MQTLLYFCSISVVSKWSSACICDTSTLSLTALDRLVLMGMPYEQFVMKVHGMGEALCQVLVNVQSRKPPEVVTTTADVLDELGLNEEATKLRGWLVCQYYSCMVSDCFDSVIESYPITSFLTVLSELYQKALISEDELHRHHRYMMGYRSKHWLDSLVHIQSFKSADVRAKTFDTLRRYSLTEVGKERQTKRTGLT